MIKRNIVSLTLLMIIPSYSSADGQIPNDGSVVVFIDQGPSGPIVKVNDRIPERGLLLELSKMRREEGTQDPKAILPAQIDTQISMLVNIRGIMKKAGYIQPIIFYIERDKDKMHEITLSAALPFRESR